MTPAKTPAKVSQQIEGLRRDAAALAASREPLHDTLARLLTSEPRFDTERDIAEARANLSRVDRELANVTERIAALTATLPTDEQRAAAEANALALRGVAQAACNQLPGLEATFIATLEAAETAARKLTSVRAEADNAIANLKAVVGDYGFQIAVPTRPSSANAELAAHLAYLLRDVAEGVWIDPTVEQYLTAIRAKVAATLVPA